MSGKALFFGLLLLYGATMSGTIASSDGHTMFLLTRSIVERGAVDVPGGNTLAGRGALSYPKAGIGQALLGVPAYFVAARAVDALPSLLGKRDAVLKFAVQLMDPLAGALLGWAFFSFLLRGGMERRAALLAALALALATPVWVYAKTCTAETWLMLLLFVAGASLMEYSREGGAGRAARAGAALGFACMIKVAMVLPAAGLGVYFLYAWRRRGASVADFAAAAAPLLAALGCVAAYNFARFGSVTQSGYGVEQTSGAYGTPLLVGLFGLLLSSGKGLFWFAPPLLALPQAAAGAWRERRSEILMLLAAVVPSLVLNARFRAWGGDGSWGPRYLVPFIPLLMIPVAWAVGRSGAARRWAVALLFAGVLAQAGGVAVNYGSYLREAGAYPYQTAFEDPRFLEDVHWVPNFSPLAGHWRMLARNLGEHLRGEWPSVRLSAAPEGPSGAAPRIALSADDQARLLHGLDFWFLYFIYAGAAGRSILVVPVLMLLGAALLLLHAWRSGVPAAARA